MKINLLPQSIGLSNRLKSIAKTEIIENERLVSLRLSNRRLKDFSMFHVYFVYVYTQIYLRISSYNYKTIY